MYHDHTIGVVIPAYNEEGFIGDVIRDMPAYVDRIFVVDDCSSDGTWEDVQQAAREDSDNDKITPSDVMFACRRPRQR